MLSGFELYPRWVPLTFSTYIVHFFAVLVDVIVVVAGLSTGLLFMIEMRVSYGVRQDSSYL